MTGNTALREIQLFPVNVDSRRLDGVIDPKKLEKLSRSPAKSV